MSNSMEPMQNASSSSTSSTSGFQPTIGGSLETEGEKCDRKDFESSMECKLAELGAKIDELSAKAEEMKEKAGTKFEELQEKRKAAAAKFQALKETSGEAFAEFKQGMELAFEELNKAWYEVKSGTSRAASKFEAKDDNK